jgi:hypothetical protein
VCRELARRHEAGATRPWRLSRLLVRHPSLLGDEGALRLQAALEQHEVLRAVVEFRDRLQQLWNGAAATHGNGVAQLREWCTQAEASGILALREFAQRLRTYVPGSAAKII